jgi:hypothetical protein
LENVNNNIQTGLISDTIEFDTQSQRVSVQSTTRDPNSRIDDTSETNGHEAACQNYSGSSHDILDWPIFKGKYDRRWIEALIFDPTLPCDDLAGPCTSPRVTDDSIRDRFEDPRQPSGQGISVREDDVPHLVEAFLVNVHVKNPIFDPDYLRKMAKDVAENGFDWRAPSCLMVRMHCSTHLSH